MPVRVVTASHEAKRIGVKDDTELQFAEDGLQILKGAGVDVDEIKEMLHSSFDNGKLPSKLLSSENGFVRSAIDAYNKHHHLTLRPEDIWFAILTQISTYINAHAEELRDKFVDHQGKKELVIEYKDKNRHTLDFAAFAYKMSKSLEESIIDLGFREWVMPKFTTTTKHDQVVASIIMMASMGSYFSFTMRSRCGIPSVTLLGQKTDYELILSRLDKLGTLGVEPSQFAEVLRPVLKRMVSTFDDPTGAPIIDFWQMIVDRCRGTGFMDGSLHFVSGIERARYHKVYDKDIPAGWSKVPVLIDDRLNPKPAQAELVSGSVGISCSASGTRNKEGKIQLDTMQPATGWWIYEKYEVQGSKDYDRKNKGGCSVQTGMTSRNRRKHQGSCKGVKKRYTTLAMMETLQTMDTFSEDEESGDERKSERPAKRLKK